MLRPRSCRASLSLGISRTTAYLHLSSARRRKVARRDAVRRRRGKIQFRSLLEREPASLRMSRCKHDDPSGLVRGPRLLGSRLEAELLGRRPSGLDQSGHLSRPCPGPGPRLLRLRYDQGWIAHSECLRRLDGRLSPPCRERAQGGSDAACAVDGSGNERGSG
jgi:hypothetical protein